MTTVLYGGHAFVLTGSGNYNIIIFGIRRMAHKNKGE